MKCGTCSRTFCYLINREFGNTKEEEERALDELAGGLVQTGHQCGMLWGAALAVGKEAFLRNKERDRAIAIAITVTQHLMESFSKIAKSVNCRDIIRYDLTNKADLDKFMKTSFYDIENSPCFNLAEKWAPEAIQSAKEGLSNKQTNVGQPSISCASEVAKTMGASEEEMVMVAGFAGGLGLSGNACGALSAAIWMKNLAWCRKHPGESPPFFDNPSTTITLEAFFGVTDPEILCQKITGQCFKTIGDHTEFVNNGGCRKLINALAQS